MPIQIWEQYLFWKWKNKIKNINLRNLKKIMFSIEMNAKVRFFLN